MSQRASNSVVDPITYAADFLYHLGIAENITEVILYYACPLEAMEVLYSRNVLYWSHYFDIPWGMKLTLVCSPDVMQHPDILELVNACGYWRFVDQFLCRERYLSE